MAALFGAGLGLAARRRLVVGAAGIAAFGLLGLAAAAADPRASLPASAGALLAAVVAGVAALHRLLAAAPTGRGATQAGQPGAAPIPPASTAAEPAAPVPAVAGHTTGRRGFLRVAALATGVAALSAASGRWLTQRSAVALARSELLLPTRVGSTGEIRAAVDLVVEGVVPFVTPNKRFYRFDTALVVPRVDVDTWRLRLSGMVDRPQDLTYDQLVDLGLSEHWTTLACVSNEVGGGLIGNALWGGVPLRTVLDLAGVQAGATQIVARSVDGWTAGFPTGAAYDGREALVAVSMNGEPLPLEHGYPVRLVVPGLYGYVSATKWLGELELTTLEAFDAYWVPRGWSKLGPIKTQSRIDVPSFGATVPAGIVPVAGVAWAQGRGISAVEVQVDEAGWQPARLAAALNDDTWRQWVWEWDATPGPHSLQVRATDGDGMTQTAERRPVMPDGATGYHTIRVNVRAADS